MEKETVIDFIWHNPFSSKAEIRNGTGYSGSDSNLKRIIADAVRSGEIYPVGSGRATTYAPRKFPDGIQTFEKIRKEGYLYVDKTDLVYSLVNRAYSYVFLSRPRRFGKSLLISTLHSYFEGNRALFQGLEIENREKNWTHYPVIRMDLSTAGDAQDTDQLYLKIGNILAENEATLPGDSSLFRASFLSRIFRTMDSTRYHLIGTSFYDDFMQRSRRLRKSLLREFLHHKCIPSLEKALAVSSWLFPHLGQIIFKLLGN